MAPPREVPKRPLIRPRPDAEESNVVHAPPPSRAPLTLTLSCGFICVYILTVLSGPSLFPLLVYRWRDDSREAKGVPTDIIVSSFPTRNITIGESVDKQSETPQNGTDNIAFFDDYEAHGQDCRLLQNVTVLGCGRDGHAFHATMICSSFSGFSVSHHVVLKVPISYNESLKPKAVYTSETESGLEEWKRTRNILLGNTTQNIRQHFVLPMGTVRVSVPVLMKEIETNRKSPQNCLELLPPASNATKSNATTYSSTTIPYVHGAVMKFAGERKVWPPELTIPDDRRRVVKDLVCIYQHMYERKFIHQDISFFHFHYDANRVSLIDFNRAELSGNNKRLQIQQFQLMSLICNVCAQEKEKFEVPNRVSSSNIDELLEKLTSLNWTLGLEQCEFENHSSPTTSLFWKESSTEQIYHTLSQWTGSCSA